MSETSTHISVVIPVLNEVESLPELHAKLTTTLSALSDAYELIYIDDGSTDNSAAWMRNMAAQDAHVVPLFFRRHYGKSAALAVGFQRAAGEYVITIDADLQDDPAEIPHLLEKLAEGFDLVSGWKRKRHDPWTKRLPSKIFNYVNKKIFGLDLHDQNCGLKIYRGEVVKSIAVYGELHRYLPVLAARQGFRVGELEVQHHPRKYGQTKYGFSRFLYGFLDLMTVTFLTSFSHRPLHLFGLVGMLLLVGGVLIDGYLTLLWFIGEGVGERPLLFLGMLMILLGIQFISIGLLGEMLTQAHRDRIADYQLIE